MNRNRTNGWRRRRSPWRFVPAALLLAAGFVVLVAGMLVAWSAVSVVGIVTAVLSSLLLFGLGTLLLVRRLGAPPEVPALPEDGTLSMPERTLFNEIVANFRVDHPDADR